MPPHHCSKHSTQRRTIHTIQFLRDAAGIIQVPLPIDAEDNWISEIPKTGGGVGAKES
jgi:hypothetical protein